MADEEDHPMYLPQEDWDQVLKTADEIERLGEDDDPAPEA